VGREFITFEDAAKYIEQPPKTSNFEIDIPTDLKSSTVSIPAQVPSDRPDIAENDLHRNSIPRLLSHCSPSVLPHNPMGRAEQWRAIGCRVLLLWLGEMVVHFPACRIEFHRLLLR
jgi:hypothetical protein